MLDDHAAPRSPPDKKALLRTPAALGAGQNGVSVAAGREISGESFWPVKVVDFLFGSRALAERTLRKVRLRERVERTGVLALSYQPNLQHLLPTLAQPRSVLSRLNRSTVYPPLLRPQSTLETVQVSAILETVRQAHAEGEPWPRLLDVLVTSSGFSWRMGADFLAKIIGRSLDAKEIAVVEGARNFWQHYAAGRARMAALRTTSALPVWQGDWAHFHREQFAELLPEIVLPDHCERHEFLTNYLHERDLGIAIYSVTGQPLFRHPFEWRFRRLT